MQHLLRAKIFPPLISFLFQCQFCCCCWKSVDSTMTQMLCLLPDLSCGLKWLCEPILDTHNLLHVGHWKSNGAGTDGDDARCRQSLASCKRGNGFFSRALQAVLVRARHLLLPPAALSRSFRRVPPCWMSALMQSLNRLCGRPCCLWPSESSPQRGCRGILVSSMRMTCPVRLSRPFVIITSMLMI